MKQDKKCYKGAMDGSITVFLTLLFGTILAVVAAAFENVRFLTADSYTLAAAEAAAVSVFGDYNQELYQQYGLFGYGGYEGHGVSDLTGSFLETLAKDLQSKPEDGNGTIRSEGVGDYTSLYRIQNISVELREVESLTDKERFYQQIEQFLMSQMVSDMTKELTELYQTMVKTGDQENIEKDLNTTSEYEHGTYQAPEDAAGDAAQSTAEDAAQNAAEGAAKDTAQGIGNPLKTFRTILRDGILNLVCDADGLSEETIEAVYTKQTQTVDSEKPETTSTAEYLKTLLHDEEGLLDDSFIETSKEKGELICYAQKVFSRYDVSQEKTFQYGMEYLVGGAAQERDNMLQVVNRLLLIRTVLNYAYVRSDASLQTASLTTATEIAGALGVPPLISAIQQTILLILAVEESCVDITALLDGRLVPVYKDAISFQMNYSEICRAGKALFQAKAKKYKTEKETGAGIMLRYEQYLWIFLLTIPEKTLRLRAYDLIQNDLQKRYNATFSLEQCTAGMQYQIEYDMPFLWNGFLPKGQKAGTIRKRIAGSYDYQ